MIHEEAKVDPTAYVDSEAVVSADCVVSRGVILLGEVRLSEEVWVDVGSVIYGPVDVGRGTYIGPHSILGCLTRDDLAGLIKERKINLKSNGRRRLMIG